MAHASECGCPSTHMTLTHSNFRTHSACPPAHLFTHTRKLTTFRPSPHATTSTRRHRTHHRARLPFDFEGTSPSITHHLTHSFTNHPHPRPSRPTTGTSTNTPVFLSELGDVNHRAESSEQSFIRLCRCSDNSIAQLNRFRCLWCGGRSDEEQPCE